MDINRVYRMHISLKIQHVTPVSESPDQIYIPIFMLHCWCCNHVIWKCSKRLKLVFHYVISLTAIQILTSPCRSTQAIYTVSNMNYAKSRSSSYHLGYFWHLMSLNIKFEGSIDWIVCIWVKAWDKINISAIYLNYFWPNLVYLVWEATFCEDYLFPDSQIGTI